MFKSVFLISICFCLIYACRISKKKSFSAEKIENLNEKLILPEGSSFRLDPSNFNLGLDYLRSEGKSSYSIQDLGTKLVTPELKLLKAKTSNCATVEFENIKRLNDLNLETDQNKIDEFEFMLRIHPELKAKLQSQKTVSIVVFWSKKYAYSINIKHIEFGRKLQTMYNNPKLFFVNSDIEKNN